MKKGAQQEDEKMTGKYEHVQENVIN